MLISLPITITKVLSSGGAAPFQMEFLTENCLWGYLRYRGGHLRCGVVKNKNDFWHGDNKWNYNVIDQQIGDDLDGWPDDEMFKKALLGKLILPDGFVFEMDYFYDESYESN